MTAVQLEGMQARAAGIRANPYPERTDEHFEWRLGFDLMEESIRQAIANARAMLIGLEDLRRDRFLAGRMSR